MNAALRDLDARLHATFAARGFADGATYAPPVDGTTSAGQRRCYVNNAGQSIGNEGRVRSPRDVIAVLVADGAVEKLGRITIGTDIFELRQVDEADGNDGSLQYWVARRV